MTKTLAVLAALPLLGLAACSSAPTASDGAGTSPGLASGASDSTISFTSRHTPTAIASCLSSRMRGVRRTSGGAATELAVGGGGRDDTWRITLTPAGAGSAVNVRKPSSDDGSIPEPEMRFHIARCVV